MGVEQRRRVGTKRARARRPERSLARAAGGSDSSGVLTAGENRVSVRVCERKLAGEKRIRIGIWDHGPCRIFGLVCRFVRAARW
jgi:hypothetical protein